MDDLSEVASKTTYRRFSLADGLILIVAIAVALTFSKGMIELILETIRTVPPGHFRSVLAIAGMGRFLNIALLNFLIPLIPAVMILRLRRPRPSMRFLRNQPGFVACGMLTFLLVVSIAWSFLVPSEEMSEKLGFVAEIVLDSAVPVAWLVLIVTRRWKPEPSWIDRLGRVLGTLYILCAPLHSILIRLPF